MVILAEVILAFFLQVQKKLIRILISMGKVMDWYTIFSEKIFEIEVPLKVIEYKTLWLGIFNRPSIKNLDGF